MIYLLDANAFMEAARLYYGFDMAPGFWTWLQGDPLSGRVGSIQAVRGEILSGEGDLVEWTRAMPSEFWLADSDASLANMRRLAEWASHSDRTYGQAAVSEFMSSADMRLIALAMAEDGVVATREVPAPRSQKKVKIPDVCDAFGVACVTPFDTYRSLGMRLV
jgi:hypothetical protein